MEKDVAGARAVVRRYPDIVRKHPTRVGELQMIHRRSNMPDHAKAMFAVANDLDPDAEYRLGWV